MRQAPRRLRTGVAEISDVQQVSRMVAQLDLETRSFHALADEGWRSLLRPDVDRRAYVDQLVSVYGFEGPLEAAFAYTPNLELVINVHERYRAGFIAQDLIALGMRPGEVARLAQTVVAPFASPIEALGWMYATERMARAHEEVRRYLDARLPAARGATVYLSTGEHGAERWRSLGRALDRTVRSARMIDDAVRGAYAGFRTWLDWSHRRPVLGKLA